MSDGPDTSSSSSPPHDNDNLSTLSRRVMIDVQGGEAIASVDPEPAAGEIKRWSHYECYPTALRKTRECRSCQQLSRHELMTVRGGLNLALGTDPAVAPVTSGGYTSPIRCRRDAEAGQ